jgi:hypothetical protein
MIRTSLTALGLLAATALTAAPATAYWEYGHETVAQIAYANVAPRTKVAIRRLLAQQALLDTPECPAGTIEEASVWADCIKPLKTADGKSRFGFAYSWHYQNIDVCAPFDLTPACKDGDCVSAQIDRDVRLLRDRKTSPHDRVQALAFLIHFVGDLHQPLHAGDRHDKGGNDVKTDYGIYAPAQLNLHSVWDGTLAERAISAPPSLVRRYPAAERARIAAGSSRRLEPRKLAGRAQRHLCVGAGRRRLRPRPPARETRRSHDRPHRPRLPRRSPQRRPPPCQTPRQGPDLKPLSPRGRGRGPCALAHGRVRARSSRHPQTKVIPAKAGTQTGYPRDHARRSASLDPRLRGDDEA